MVLLVLEVVTLALTGGLVGTVFWCVASDAWAPAIITMVIVALLVGGVALARTILGFMALDDIYASCDPQNATVYLVLSIFFKFLRPIFLFVIRDGDQGYASEKDPAGDVISRPKKKIKIILIFFLTKVSLRAMISP